MSVLLFKLNGVPDDEAIDVRELLSENDIDFYETPGGNWGISVAGIWLHDKEQLPAAKALLANYQAERFVRVREEYQQLRAEGGDKTLLDRMKENPLQVIVMLVIAGAVLWFSARPFFGLGE